jgi:hypothetical protein
MQTSRRAVGRIPRDGLSFIRWGYRDHAHTDLPDAAVIPVANPTGCTADASATDACPATGTARSGPSAASWRDNVFVERLWRSVKYEEVYLRAYDSVSEARASIGRYFDFYNGRRPHASLDGNTPDRKRAAVRSM